MFNYSLKHVWWQSEAAPNDVVIFHLRSRSCARVEDEDGAVHRLRGQVASREHHGWPIFSWSTPETEPKPHTYTLFTMINPY